MEYLRLRGNTCAEQLVRIFNTCFECLRSPNELEVACVVPLCKGKGDPWNCNKNLGLNLLLLVGKKHFQVLMDRALGIRLAKWLGHQTHMQIASGSTPLGGKRNLLSKGC